MFVSDKIKRNEQLHRIRISQNEPPHTEHEYQARFQHRMVQGSASPRCFVCRVGMSRNIGA